MKPFRFGYQITGRIADPVAAARRAEEIGFDVVLAPDHVGPGWSPIPLLAAIATATTAIRLRTYVANVVMRNPVHLAWEASTIDRLSGGRFELGLGAGHTPQEFDQVGIEMPSASDRKSMLCEQVEIIRRLLDGETVDHDGPHHTLRGASIDRATQARVPILVGGNGATLLAHAGAHADIVGLQGLGRTLADGHSHDVRWDPAHLDRQLEQIRAGAGERFEEIELDALVQIVVVTASSEEGTAATTRLRDEHGLDPDHLGDTPYVLVGTVGEIVARLHRCRERWGITSFTVRDLDEFAPIIAAMRRPAPGGGTR